jgi:hypothetical protein
VRSENIFIYLLVYFSFIKPMYAHPTYITIKFFVYSHIFGGTAPSSGKFSHNARNE